MHWLRTRLTATLAVLILTMVVLAQAPDRPPAGPPPGNVPPPELPKGVAKPEPVPLPPPESDPTVPSVRLKEAMDKGKPGPAAQLPKILLKGLVIVKDRPPTAMLDVNGKLCVVSKGSVVMAPGNLVLKITELTKNEARVLVSPLNETITLR